MYKDVGRYLKVKITRSDDSSVVTKQLTGLLGCIWVSFDKRETILSLN